jgi:thiol-disulfide isomerase/thioredoxin
MNLRMALMCAGILCVAAGLSLAADAPTLNDVYPSLLNGPFSSASFGPLPDGVLARFGDQTVTADELAKALANAPEKLRPQLEKNALFLAQEVTTQKLLSYEARQAAAENAIDITNTPEAQIISDHLQRLVADVTVSDEEVKDFYEKNAELFDGASYAKVESALREFVRKQKRQTRVDDHVRGMGRTHGVVIAEEWGRRQAELALDNPVDQARMNQRPTMVDFGATGCRPCELMAPILETLKTKYKGKADILFVHVQEEQVLAARFGIQSIPVQVFFDAAGREVYRHEGFYPQEDIEKRLEALGAK